MLASCLSFDTPKAAPWALRTGIFSIYSGFVHMNENPIGMRGLPLGMW